MYCDEPIKNAYLGRHAYESVGDYFFDYYCDMTLHITPSYRIILETENFYIALQSDGVFKLDKNGDINSIEKENEEIESFNRTDDDAPEEAPWVDYEYTLFNGEKILDVESSDEGYTAVFSDFRLKVIPYSDNEKAPRFTHAPYNKVLGSERLLKNCSCGGTGILRIDDHGDYVVRCEICHLSTCAEMCAVDAVKEWNDEKDLYEVEDYPSEQFQKYCTGKIDYIAISDDYLMYDENLLGCESVIVRVSEKLFMIKSSYAGSDNYDFSFYELSDFNPECWPRQILPSEAEPIRFIRKETEPFSYPVLRFELGSRPLLITADEDGITVGLSHWNCEGNKLEYENNRLLNDNPQPKKWRFSIAGNIVKQHTDEEGIIRYGTKAFSGGTKVYIAGKTWESDEKDVGVIGRNRFGKIVVETVDLHLIENFRPQRIYHPKVLEIIDYLEYAEGWDWWERTASDQRETEALSKLWNLPIESQQQSML